MLAANVNCAKFYAVRTYSSSIIRFVCYCGMIDFSISIKSHAMVNGMRDETNTFKTQIDCDFFWSTFIGNAEHLENESVEVAISRMCNE